MGIKVRILVLLLAVVALTTSLVGALAFSRARQALIAAIGGALVNASVETLDKIDRELAERHEDIRHWARLDSVTRAALGEVDPDLKVLGALDEIRRSYDHIPNLLVSSPDGKVQAATDARMMGKPLPADLLRVPGRAASGVACDGPRTVSVLPGPALVMRAPIELAEARVDVGDLICLIEFEEVLQILDGVRITGDRPAWFVLMDASGRPIALPRELRADRKSRDYSLADLGLQIDPQLLVGHTGYLIVRNRTTGDEDLIGFAPARGYRGFAGLGWILLFRVSGTEAFASVRELGRQVITVGVVLGALVLALGAAMALQLVRPIQQITDAMKRVRDGDFESAISVRGTGEVARLVESYNFMLAGLKDRELIRDVFSRHVSPVVARKLLSERDALALSGERRRATILFTDIRSFTTLSEHLPAPEVVELLNEYFAEMVDVVFRHDGFVNKFIGDALMAVWGVPYEVPHPTASAAFAALEMQERIAGVSARRKARGQATVEMGIGFTTGDVIAGKIGSPQRMEYTVIGDQVNVASRIEGLTKQFGAPVMMSESAYREIQEICQAEPLGEVKVKGREQPIGVYRLVSMTVAVEDLRGKPAGN